MDPFAVCDSAKGFLYEGNGRMKLKEGIMINEIDGRFVAVDAGEGRSRFHGILKMNGTACFVAKVLQDGADLEQIVKAMTEKYEVSAEEAKRNAEKVIDAFQRAGLIDEI